ncbi:MAG: DUF4136 domain-containing protein [Puniceicoccaceae bacterium]
MKTTLSSLLLLLVFLAGCETTPDVNVQSGPDFDPSKYNTFAVLEPEKNALTPGASVHYATLKMLIAGPLKSKGLTETDLESADIVFQAVGGAIPMVSPSQYGFVWVGDWYTWQPTLYRRSNMNSQSAGMIAVNAFDNQTKEIVWQGVAYGHGATAASGSGLPTEAIKSIMAGYPAK